MKKSQIFWQKLKKPILAIAPMAGFTDSAFRQICKEFGADVVYSEMASASALAYNPKKTLEMLQRNKKEAPYVIQLFGGNPEHFAKAVKLIIDKKQISKLRISNYQLPQGIDINFGCPVKKAQKQGAGAVLMNDLKKARETIKSVVDNTDLPVSIKCRSRVGDVYILKFLDKMSDLDIKAVMIHGRTLAQGFSGPVDWKIIKKARGYFKGIILANGGIMSAQDAYDLFKKTGADGVGIARGALGNPWIFRGAKTLGLKSLKRKNAKTRKRENKEEIFKTAMRHAKLAYKLKGNQGIREMRKHLCFYVARLPGARKMRERLVRVEKLEEIEKILLS